MRQSGEPIARANAAQARFVEQARRIGSSSNGDAINVASEEGPLSGGGMRSDAKEVLPFGAAVPWVTHMATEAEPEGRIEVIDLDSNEAIARESVARECIRLTAEGDGLTWTVTEPANAVVVRHCIPDSPAGDGLEATLSLYVNGVFRQKLTLSSAHAWLYGEGENPQSNDPSRGNPHCFFDDARAFIAGDPLVPGDRVTLRKASGDNADWYVIDLIDLENVPSPMGRPVGYLSVADFGAVADDGKDDSAAYETCLEAATREGKGIWIPAGTFHQARLWRAQSVKVAGAGPWYTRLMASLPDADTGFAGNCGFRLGGENVEVRDLMIVGRSYSRKNPDQHGFTGGAQGFLLENVWVEHTKTGGWVGGSSNGVVRNCRFRNTYADGFNINNNSSDILLVNNTTRNTGDDGLASFANTDHRGVNGTCARITIANNTCDAAWWGNGMGVYGGVDVAVTGNLIRGAISGLKVSTDFKSWPGDGIEISYNRILDCGGLRWSQQMPAVLVYVPAEPINGLIFIDNEIVSPLYNGFKFKGLTSDKGMELDAMLENNLVTNSGGSSLYVMASVKGGIYLVGNQFSATPPAPAIVNQASPGQLEFEVL